MDNGIAQAGNSSHQSSRLSSVERSKPSRKKISIKKLIKPIVILLFIGLVVLIGVFLYKSTTSSKIDSSKYQAVFLTNGQVYFGKLKIQNGGYIVLSNIYYLQTKTKTDDDGNLQAATNEEEPNVELVKLGSEVHGPVDEMVINKDQVLFFENLKQDGNLTKTIIDFESKN